MSLNRHLARRGKTAPPILTLGHGTDVFCSCCSPRGADLVLIGASTPADAYEPELIGALCDAHAAGATLLRAQRRLRLHIETGSAVRDVQTLTLFVGNNRLQLQQFGAEPEDTIAGTPGDGSMAALMLRPIGTLAMLKLMLHGAMGRLGEAAGVESFEFKHMVVKPTLCTDHTELVVAFDGEVARMRAPIDIRVLEKPLYLLQNPDQAATATGSEFPA